MATIDKNLGTVTAYKYAKNAGYEGTEEEFAQGLKNSAEYADNAQESATAAAGSATAAATSATNAANANTAAQSAKTAAQTAQTAAEAWATGGSGSTPSATNNAQYWSEKSEEWAQEVNPENLAHIDGSYPDMTVGNAEQFVTNVGVEDAVPYNFRTAGGSAEIGNRVDETVVGGSLLWNQRFLAPFTNTINGITFTRTDNYSIKLSGTATQVIYKQCIDTLTYAGHVYLTDSGTDNPNVRFCNDNKGVGSIARRAAVGKAIADKSMYIRVASGAELDETIKPQIIDLTLMFGSTIADYVYSLEQANAGAGVAWFRKLFPKDYYAYNAGTMVHVQTSAHETVGFNQWDEEWEPGGISSNTGNNTDASSTIRSKNYIPVFPGVSYYYKTPKTIGLRYYDANKNFLSYTTVANSAKLIPVNCYFVRFIVPGTTTYNHTICINLSWDGSRNGEYEPYVKHTYPLDDSLTLRGIPKLDENDRLYFDGDIYSADGMVTRRAAERAYQSGDESLADAITDGTTTVYLLDTLTTEEADPFQSPQIVDDFGTERYVDYAYEAGARDFEMPVGHDSLYQANLKAKLEMAPNSPSGDGDYIVRQSDGMNAYVPLEEVRELPTPPSEDGTYRLTVTVTDGTPAYSWVQA